MVVAAVTNMTRNRFQAQGNMTPMFRWFAGSRGPQEAAEKIYDALAQSRNPAFYIRCSVPIRSRAGSTAGPPYVRRAANPKSSAAAGRPDPGAGDVEAFIREDGYDGARSGRFRSQRAQGSAQDRTAFHGLCWPIRQRCSATTPRVLRGGVEKFQSARAAISRSVASNRFRSTSSNPSRASRRCR